MSATTSSPAGGIAITGMACLYPGAPGLDAYWQNILGKRDCTCDPPPEAWDPRTHHDPSFADPDRTYVKRGGWLGSLAEFDPLAYGIPPVAVGGEPDQWLALKVAHEALEDAGGIDLPESVRARTAVIFGKGTYLNGGNAIAVQRTLVVGQTIELIRQLHPERTEPELEELRQALERSLPPLGSEQVAGLIPNIIVGRIANRLDLMGPSYTVDAACASSLVAVQHASRALLTGECDLALAGGSQVWMPIATLNLFCRLGALSHREQLRAFDEDADGTLLGEGIGAVVLKRTEDALADGDRIYAVLRGIGVASDGRGMSVMAPRLDGEELALRRAYAEAGVDPSSVGLIEAHGTGTPVGDVTEVQALTRVFGERRGELAPTALGSVKSMISHTIPAAGIASIIKVALALHHRVLPPTLHVERPNPKLELERTPFYLNTETRPWIHGDPWPRRAGVNAFGFGGINAHAVLEEPPAVDAAVPHRQPRHARPWDAEVFVLSGESPQELLERAGELEAALERRPELALADLACSLADEVGEAGLRLAIVAGSTEELCGRLAQARAKLAGGDCRRIRGAGGIYYESEPIGRDGKLVLIFPGEGAQYPGMLADLCLSFPEARAVFDRIDRLYRDHPRGFRLSDWVFPRPAFSAAEREAAEARLMALDLAVESVLTANAAAYAVLSRVLGRVDAMLGHSSGEHSAAMASGALDVETDERLIAFCRGLNDSYAQADARHAIPGAVLLAVGAGAGDVGAIAEQAGGELYLAMDNCPHQTVLVGESKAIARAREIATEAGFVCEQLPYDRAVHTPLFAPFAEDLRAVFAALPVRAPAGALWSCTTAAPYPDDPGEIRELIVEHWTSPVRFRETVEALYDDGARVFVECGPRGNLTAFVQDILRGRPSCAVALDVLRRSGTTQLCHLVAALAAQGVPLHLGPLFEGRDAAPVDWRGEAEPGGGPRAPRPLLTGWPTMRLPDEVAHSWRARQPARAVPVAPEPVVAVATLEPAPTVAAELEPALAVTPTGAEVLPVAIPPVAVTATAAELVPLAGLATLAPPDLDGVDEAVSAHLETMQHFLEASEEVMQAYLASAAAVSAPVRRPLLGEVVSLVPGAELVARRIFDPAADHYLLDHTLGRVPSRREPDVHALALMPLAMSIEILAEAAAELAPDLLVTGLRDIRAHRWIAFPDGARTLEVRASVLDAVAGLERVHVELHDLDAEPPAAGPVVEGIVLLAGARPSPPASLELTLADGRPSRYPPADLYELMFHGPAWRAVRSIDEVGVAGARARLHVPPREGLIAGEPAPAFELDPVVLDGAGQVIGFWTADRLTEGRVVFPFRLAALDLFGPPRPAGEELTCTAAIRLNGTQLVASDIDVLDATGSCHMRLTGWEDKRFAIPARLEPLTLPVRLPSLSAPWPEPLPAAADLPLACRRLDSRLDGDRELWAAVWAGRLLSRDERRLLESRQLPAAARLQWLAARTAAKEAVAELTRAATGLELWPAEIAILPDEQGRPVVALAELAAAGLDALVSLTHAGDQAAALAALVPAGQRAGVGIDLEPLRPRPAGFAQAAFSPAEGTLLDGVPADERDEWELRLWCAREAAGKALGTGLAARPQAPRAITADLARGQVTVRAGAAELTVHTRREQQLIVATTIWRGM